jgi:superfamily II DNA/RNA helicase
LKPLYSHEIEVKAETSETNSDGSTEQLVAEDVSSSSSSDASLLTGSDFTEFIPHLPEWLQLRCQECGWNHPQRSFSNVPGKPFPGRKEDVVLQAQTGSGKTLAFLVPLLADIEPNRAAIQTVIVVPTRELGLQVGRVAKRLTANKTPIMIMNILQGSSNKRQRAWAWSEPPQVVIGTPQELTDMVQYGGFVTTRSSMSLSTKSMPVYSTMEDR